MNWLAVLGSVLYYTSLPFTTVLVTIYNWLIIVLAPVLHLGHYLLSGLLLPLTLLAKFEVGQALFRFYCTDYLQDSLHLFWGCSFHRTSHWLHSPYLFVGADIHLRLDSNARGDGPICSLRASCSGEEKVGASMAEFDDNQPRTRQLER